MFSWPIFNLLFGAVFYLTLSTLFVIVFSMLSLTHTNSEQSLILTLRGEQMNDLIERTVLDLANWAQDLVSEILFSHRAAIRLLGMV